MFSALTILDVHPFLRPPMWRAMVARALVDDGCDPSSADNRDMWLSLAIADENAKRSGRRMKGASAKHVCNARALHEAARPGGWRWYVEALLCTGMSDSGIAETLELPFDCGAIQAFRRMYFDVDCYRNAAGSLSRTALEANILSCSRSRLATLSSHDYVWKRVAARFGAKGFIDFAHGDYAEDHRSFMVSMASARNLETAAMFSEAPAVVATTLGAEMALAFLKLPEDIRTASEKQKMLGGEMSMELEEYFSIMCPLMENSQKVVTSGRKVYGITIEGGRGVQQITSGGRQALELAEKVEVINV